MSSSDIYRCQHLLTDYAYLLARHEYLKEQLTTLQQKLTSKPSERYNVLSHQEKEQLDAIEQRLKALQNDPWLDKLFSVAQNESQVEEIERYMQRWGVGNPEQKFTSPAHCIVWHANKHGGGEILRYLRKAGHFNKRRAKSKWIKGSKRWIRKNGEFLIERDSKMVSYGMNSSQ